MWLEETYFSCIKVEFPMGKGIENASLSRDKGTMGQPQNLAMGRAGMNFDISPRDGLEWDRILTFCLGRDFEQSVHSCPWMGHGTERKNDKKKLQYLKKKLSRDKGTPVTGCVSLRVQLNRV